MPSYGYGLYVVDIDPPEDAEVISDVDLLRGGYGVDVHGGYAYVAAFEGGLRIVQLW